ncbi:hypothetical protein ABZS66_41710 [Dactylosporangium sp. NPDC005572]|uniref:hypothetical protein n=1 Tax=Dactylosporangium sp. NPDC005572 TaxID=3156889 RepID=UPI00339E2D37
MTGRLPFAPSGARPGILVTALLAGHVAVPHLGAGLAPLIGVGVLSTAAGLSISVGRTPPIATALADGAG